MDTLFPCRISKSQTTQLTFFLTTGYAVFVSWDLSKSIFTVKINKKFKSQKGYAFHSSTHKCGYMIFYTKYIVLSTKHDA